MNRLTKSSMRTMVILTLICSFSINAIDLKAQVNTNSKYNGKIVFTSDRHNEALNVWTMNADGSNPTRLTFTTPRGAKLPASSRVYDDFPVWSPDGTKIAFLSNRDYDHFLYDRFLYVMNSDGSNVRLVTGNVPNMARPQWSPDGMKIAVSGGMPIAIEPNKPVVDIYVINVSDGSFVQLTKDSATNSSPTWSPDGKQIAFISDREADNPPNPNRRKIWVMNSDGSNQRKVTDIHNTSNPRFYNDNEVAWSPDGLKLVFTGSRDDNGTRDCINTQCNQIYTINSDGSNESRLTNDFNLVNSDKWVQWSPDGTKLVFVRDLTTIEDSKNSYDRGRAIVVMNSDGSNQQQITFRSDQTATDTVPSWQPLSSPMSESPTAILSFSQANYSAFEDSGSIPITVTRAGNLNVAVSCFYATDIARPTSDITADPQHDYLPVYGTLQFAPGETAKTILIPLTDNGDVRGNRTFKIALYDNDGNSTFLSGIREATITKLDRDATPRSTNPIDQPSYFVRQQYVDFLNREPDASGSQFWTNEITSCNGNAAYIDLKRQNVSAAFYLSTEFQETDYFLLRARTLLPDANYAGFFGFERALQQVGRGVIVGQPNWQQQLEANKQTFIQQFFDDDRADLSFGRTNAEYVDLLYQYAAVQPDAANRNALISSLDAGTQTRAGVLCQIVDDAQFKQNSFQQAFVLMQYYGYLRREPDAGGYNFWLNKLNQFGGDYIGSEMVRSFIVSSEYRQRFGR
jgi:Tol biopolymer transport system component